MDVLRRLLTKTGHVLTKTLQYGCVVYCASYAATPRLCQGQSMMPTICPNNVVIYESITAKLFMFQKGDVVVAQGKNNPHQILCKRIVAMEHDRVYNNKTGKFVQVPKGHVWLEGDNRDVSEDSRDMGPFPYGLLRGRAYLKVTPEVKFIR